MMSEFHKVIGSQFMFCLILFALGMYLQRKEEEGRMMKKQEQKCRHWWIPLIKRARELGPNAYSEYWLCLRCGQRKERNERT
jgi:hypothetical protein